MQHIETVLNKNYGGLNPVQMGYQDCAPSHSFGPAVREHWLLHYVVSGFGVFRRDGVTYHVGPGEVFVIPPYLETYYEADAKKPWTYIWIGFTTEMELPDVFSLPVIRHPGMMKVFEDIRACSDFENGKSAYLSGCLWHLTALLLESAERSSDYCEKAISIMHAEYANDIGVAQIASRVGLDRSYFSTIFKNKLGISPVRYLTNLRLQRAAELMSIHGESPSIAALSVGYPDISYFSKAFKQRYGVSPRTYRKQRAAK